MPASPYAKVLVSVNGGDYQSGGITVNGESTIHFKGESTAGWGVSRWEILGLPTWLSTPGWMQENGKLVYVGSTEDPPTITLPAADVGWGKFMVVLTVNNGIDSGLGGLVDTTTAIEIVAPSGLRDIGIMETSQFGGSIEQWVASLRANYRLLESVLSGGGSSNSASPFTPFTNAHLDGTNDPTWETYKTPVKAYSFPDALTKALHMALIAPAQASSGLIPELHWQANTSGAGVVRWQIDVTAANENGVFGSATSLVVDASTPAVADKHTITKFTSLTGLTPGAVIALRIARIGGDSNDTYTDKVWGMGIGLGIGMYTAPAPISPVYNELNFTANATSYAGTTYTRSGASVYVQTGATTIVSRATNEALWEDKQDGAGGGVWVTASYTNEVTQPHNLSDAYWLTLNAPTVTAPGSSGVVGPDGVTNMSTVEDTGANERVVYKTGFTEGAPGYPKYYMSAWTKQVTAPSAGQGLMGQAYTATSLSTPHNRICATLSGTSTALHRLETSTQGYGNGNIYFGAGGYTGGNNADGTTAAFAVDTAATGKQAFGFVMMHKGGAHLPYAAPGSGTGNAVLALDTALATGKLVDSGDLDVEIEFIAGQDSYDQRSTTEPVVFDGYLWSGTSTDGEMSLRYVQGTGAENQSLILKVRGVDVLTKTSSAIPDGFFGWRKGDRVKVRSWYRISTNQCGIRYSVNNVTWYVDDTGATTGGALAVATTAHIGSLGGSSNFWPMRVTRFRVYVVGSPPSTHQPALVYLGDSTGAPYSRQDTTLQKVILNSETKVGMVCAVSGHMIQDQLTRWNAIVDKSQIACAIINCGFNNLGSAGESSTTVAGRLQGLIDQIKTDRPTAKIIVCKLHPCKAFFGGDATRYNNWLDLNATKIPALTSVDAIVSSHVAIMNDGSDNLSSSYGIDSVHPHHFGRHVTAGAIRTACVSLGVLP